MASKKMQSV